MTKDQQATLEQAASKAMETIAPMLRNGVGPETKVYQWAKDAIIEVLAAQRAAVLEDGATKVESFAGSLTAEQCEGCGNYDDVAEGSSNNAYRYAATQLRQLAQEQRP